MKSESRIPRRWTLALAAVLLVPSLAAFAQDRHPGHGMGGGERNVEAQRAPFGYQRIERPREVDMRPREMDPGRYRHDFRAAQPYRIGPYHAPPGFEYRRWRYGDILPAVYWGDEYRLSDFWLFGLDLPPVGYEWVRYGADGLMINLANGEIVQTVYGVFL